MRIVEMDMGRRRWSWLAAAVLLGAQAEAQRRGGEVGDVNVALEAGVSGYTGPLDDYTATGPSWGAAVLIQPWTVLGLELGYDGSRHLVTDDRLPTSPAVTRHGGTALVRLSPPLLEKVKPFVGVGVGASWANVTGDARGLYRDDLMQELPLAAGVDFNSGGLTAGLRTTYRLLIDEGFADPAQAVGNPEGGLLEVGATLGLRF